MIWRNACLHMFYILGHELFQAFTMLLFFHQFGRAWSYLHLSKEGFSRTALVSIDIFFSKVMYGFHLVVNTQYLYFWGIFLEDFWFCFAMKRTVMFSYSSSRLYQGYFMFLSLCAFSIRMHQKLSCLAQFLAHVRCWK